MWVHAVRRHTAKTVFRDDRYDVPWGIYYHKAVRVVGMIHALDKKDSGKQCPGAIAESEVLSGYGCDPFMLVQGKNN